MAQEEIPKLHIGDWIRVGNWGFRLEELIERPGGDVHVKFINANEAAKDPK